MSPYGIAFAAAVCFLTVMSQLLPQSGALGHDYSHAFARLYYGAAHFWRNGFDVPHFTPSLTGGIPFFADPQSTFYSLPQFLSFVMDPLQGMLLTYGLMYALGYWGVWLLGSRIFKWSSAASHLSAIVYLLNGFSFAHLVVGHTTHHTFLLFPLLVYALLIPLSKGWWQVVQVASTFSLAIIYTFYSGCVHMLIVFLVTMSILMPYAVNLHRERGDLKRFLVLCGCVAVFVLVACSAKLVVIRPFSKYAVFNPVEAMDVSVPAMLVRYFWFNPFDVPYRIFVSGGFVRGSWEFTGFVSRLSIPALLAFCYFFFFKSNRRDRSVLCLFYMVWLPLLFLVAAGSPLTESLPFVRGYHNPIKILGSFILFFSLFVGYAFHRLPAAIQGNAFYMIVPLLIVEFLLCTPVIQRSPGALMYRYQPQVYQLLKENRGIPPVATVTRKSELDEMSLVFGRTSLSAYEPLFGYRHEKVYAKLTPGPTGEIQDGFFNMNHPACFLYPTHAQCTGWDRIPAAQADQFSRFIEGRSVDEWVPQWHHWWLRATFVFVLTLVGVACSQLSFGFYRRYFSFRVRPPLSTKSSGSAL